MRTSLLLLFTALGFALGLQSAPAWAFTTDGQEDICATAAVIFCDNFETGSFGAHYKMRGWQKGAGGEDTTSIVTTEHQDGSRALQFAYDANAGAGFLEAGIGTHSDLYIRYYVKYSSNFKFSAIATKAAEWRDQNGLTDMLFGGTCNGCTGSLGGNAVVYGLSLSNHTPAILNPNPRYPDTVGFWHCHEFHTRMNTSPSANDGLIEGWIEGVQYWNYPNINVVNQSGTPAITAILHSGYWNCASGDLNMGGAHQPCSQNGDSNNSHPAQQRFLDNLVISTQRIGCLGSVRDTVPPEPPQSVRVQ